MVAVDPSASAEAYERIEFHAAGGDAAPRGATVRGVRRSARFSARRAYGRAMDETLTLALDVTALRRLRDAAASVEDAREWVDVLGVVATDPPHVLTKAVRDYGLEPEFTSGPGGVNAATLADARAQNDTDRHVYVGTTEEHSEMARAAEWEFLTVTDAAEAAGWRVQYAPPDAPTEAAERDDDWP